MNELAPKWSNPKMTKSQVRKYIKDMKKKQEEAKKKLEEANLSWEMEKEKQEIIELEKKLDNL